MTQSSLTLELTEKKCREDLNFFAGFCIPEESVFAYPEFYLIVWQFLLYQIIKVKSAYGTVYRFALGLPRGHLKTTYAKLLIAFGITYKLFDFVLIVAASEDRAQDILSDVYGILTSANFIKLYGTWTAAQSKNTKEVKIAHWQGREVILVAIGAGTSLRGINIKNKRPDFMLLDDVQTKENDNSPTDSKRLLQWILSTLLKARSPKGCFIFYLGNMYSDHCILKQLQDSKQWTTLITGAILADVKALWPELRSIDSLLEEYEHDAALGEADIWFAEIMNDPQSVKKSLFPTGKIEPSPYDEENELAVSASFITIDPAGYRRTSDQNVCVAHGIIDDIPIILEMIGGRWNPEETIRNAVTLALNHNATVIGIESIAYQQTLKFWMELYLTNWELSDYITIIELHSGIRSKESRIREWTKQVTANLYHVLRKNDRAILLFEGLRYKLGQKENVDDYLDTCAYGLDVINKHRDELEYDFSFQAEQKARNAADAPRVIPYNSILDQPRGSINGYV